MTTTYTRCICNDGTDYGDGPGGTGQLKDVTPDPDPIDPQAIATATVRFNSIAGAVSILPMSEIRVWVENSGSGVVRRLVGGFCGKPQRRYTRKTDYGLWTVTVQGYGLLGTRLVGYKGTAFTISIPAAKFLTQITDLLAAIQTQGGLPTESIFADNTTVLDLSPATVLSAKTFSGQTLNEMVQAICDDLHGVHSAIFPKFRLGMLNTVGGGAGWANCGGATLYAWDDAAARSTSFAFKSTLAVAAGGYQPMRGDISREEDALALYNYRENVWGAGSIVVGFRADSAAAYPNRYSGDGYWHEKPLKDSQSATVGAATALIQADVDAKAIPIDRIEFGSELPLVAPGETDTITFDEEGLTDQPYTLAAVRAAVQRDPYVDLKNIKILTFGAPVEELGDTGLQGAAGLPVEGASVPLPPTRPSIVSNLYNPSTRKTDGTFSTTGSVSETTLYYFWTLRLAGLVVQTSGFIPRVGNYPTLQYWTFRNCQPGTVYTVVVQACNAQYQGSDYSTARSFPAAKGVNTLPGSFGDTGPDYTGGLVPGWNADTSGGGTVAAAASNVQIGSVSIILTV